MEDNRIYLHLIFLELKRTFNIKKEKRKGN